MTNPLAQNSPEEEHEPFIVVNKSFMALEALATYKFLTVPQFITFLSIGGEFLTIFKDDNFSKVVIDKISAIN
ncbi:MAG: hypothetical protein F6K62_07085 [Sphaerospermopsis sp. SIO1G2]|nr:hypothetical protein [Sphaerospermopsis sp. SIO1G2]